MLEPIVVWGLYLRALGAIYVVVFSSLLREARIFGGRRGIAVVEPQRFVGVGVDPAGEAGVGQGLEGSAAPRLGVDVTVIQTPSCIFSMKNH